MASLLSWFGFSGSRKTARRRSVHQAKLVLEVLESRLAPSATDVLQYHNDASSDGQNLNETILTPSNVNSTSFGKLFSTAVDGQVYAQPLFVSGVPITTGSHQGVHDVVFVATENDSLYAIDANTGILLWKDSFLKHGLPHATSITPVPTADAYGNSPPDITPEIGITSTPVIDPNTGTLFLVAKTKEIVQGVSHYVQRLHAINVNNGSEQLGGPAVIADTMVTIVQGSNVYTYVSGPSVTGITGGPADSGDGNVNGVITFNALTQNQRSALTLANGEVYIAWASHGDIPPYHGWVMGFNASTLHLDAAFNTTPNGSGGGIWSAGNAVTVDATVDGQGNHYLYVMTGNGTFETSLDGNGFPNQADYGDSIIKLEVDKSSSPTNQNANGWGLKVSDYFTPYDQNVLDAGDGDLGSGGVLLLPDSQDPSIPHLLVGAGKEGTIYLVNRDNMGHFNTDPNATSDPNIVQELKGGVPNGGSYDTPAYFNGSFYYAGNGDNLQQFTVSSSPSGVSFTAGTVSLDNYGFPGATPSISANGTSNALVWALNHDLNELRAYDATNLQNVNPQVDSLYNSATAPNRDNPGTLIKFSVPTVTNGHVYVGTSNQLVVYGLLPPILINAGGGATGSFVADSHFSGGKTGHVTHPISGITGSVPPSVFQSFRSGSSFSYILSNLVPNAAYVVQLDFAEVSATAAGQRLIDVSINNNPVPTLTNFDIFATTGGDFKAVEEQVTTTADSSGNITIKLTSAPGSRLPALVSGVEVFL